MQLFTNKEVPTHDEEVRAVLRSIGQPLTLFGEGPYERRERLRTLAVGVENEAEDESDEAAEEEIFYTVGSEALRSARLWMANYSIKAASQRLQRERRIREDRGPNILTGEAALLGDDLRDNLGIVGSQVGDGRPLTIARLSPDATLAATASWVGSVRLWDLPSCSHVKTLMGHTDRVNGLAWHPSYTGYYSDSHTSIDESDETSERVCLASGSADKKVILWDTHRNSIINTLIGHEDRVNRIAFHPSGNYLGSTSHDTTWRLWDVNSGRELLLQEGHGRGVYCLAFHPDGSVCVSADLGGMIRVWDIRSGKCVLPLEGHVKMVLGVDIHPSLGYIIASCSDDHAVRIWDLRKRKTVTTLLAHNKLISDVKFEPEMGRFLLSSSYDGTVRMWESCEWKCFRSLVAGVDAKVSSVDTTTDGRLIISSNYDRTFKLCVCVCVCVCVY
eukprot:GHVR01147607.1.p1 GENE.GHVR01147607.1~~GHVR01147607.1.p1  ORF type:complete len:445 (-),score=132.78 GHVR01147607.1:130-1464(-)